MLPLPAEIVLYVLSFVDDLLDISRATKSSREFAQRSIRHPAVAARRGDRFSIKWYTDAICDAPLPNISRRVTSIMTRSGHLKLAVRFSRKTCSLLPNVADMLAGGSEDVIHGIIMTMSQEYARCAKIRYAIGKLGPNSMAFKVFASIKNVDDEVFVGLCRGGHLEEVKRHLWPASTSDRSVCKSIRSGSTLLTTYALRQHTGPVEPIMCMWAAFRSRDVIMVQLISALILEMPQKFDLPGENSPAELIRIMREVRGLPSSKEIHEFCETLGIVLSPLHLSYNTSEDYLIFLYNKDPVGYNVDVSTACRKGFMRLSSVLISEGKECTFCGGKFHQ